MHTSTAKAQAQTQLVKDSRAEKPNAQGPEPSTTPQHSNNSEFLVKS